MVQALGPLALIVKADGKAPWRITDELDLGIAGRRRRCTGVHGRRVRSRDLPVCRDHGL
jgi:hypothetical protein